MDNESLFLYGIVLMSWVEYLWNFYLTYRQRRVLTSSHTVPSELSNILTEETFCKAKAYNLDNITFGIIHSLYDSILSTLMIVLFLMPYFWKVSTGLSEKIGYGESEIIISIIFMLILNTVNIFISTPFQVYHTFVIEERHGFNKQTPLFFIKDALKAFALTQVLIVIVTSPTVYIVKAGGKYFFVYLWIFVLIFTLFFMTIYPDIIAPLFDKYTPLEDGELKSKIEQLAASVNFPLTKIYVVEGSKRSAHSNAYFYGFYKNKRIVLFDTLLKDYKTKQDDDRSTTITTTTEQNEDHNTAAITESIANASDTESISSTVESSIEPIVRTADRCENVQSSKSNKTTGCTDDEVLAVLAHELGHWKKNHVLFQMIISEINLFFLFVLFSYLYEYDFIYRAFGFYDVKPVLMGMLIIIQFIFTPYHFLFQLFATVITRKFEFQADDFATSLGKGDYLKKSLIKLNQDNLGFPIYDWLYSMFNHSHPPLLERIRAINEKKLM